MSAKIVTFLTLIGILMGAMLIYANVAYFPMDRGVAVEQKVESIQRNIDVKLDRILVEVGKK